MKVLVLNQYAANKGDRAILWFLVRELARCEVDEITVSTSEPALWQGTDFGVDVPVRWVPWGWNIGRCFGRGIVSRVLGRVHHLLYARTAYSHLRACANTGRNSPLLGLLCHRQFYRALQQADLVISTGGHHLTTFRTDGGKPQLSDMAACLCAGKKLLLWSQSLGPFVYRKPADLRLTKEILIRSVRVVIRDDRSAEEIAQLGLPQVRLIRNHDTVFGLSDLLGDYVTPTARRREVGVAVFSGRRRTREAHERYIVSLATLLRDLAANGMLIRFFPMELKHSRSDDRWLIREVVTRAELNSQNHRVEPDRDTPAHLAEVAKCRMFVGHKTHSVIFSLLTGTPLVAIAYHPKTSDFMREFGLSEFCVDEEAMTPHILASMARDLERNLDGVGRSQQARARHLGKAVRDGFRDVMNGCTVRCPVPRHGSPAPRNVSAICPVD